MEDIEQLQDRLNDLTNDVEVVQILHAKLVNEIEEIRQKLEDLDEDLDLCRNSKKRIETQEGLETYRANIGGEARITNPGLGEPSVGTIRRVDDFYVHIDLPNGTSRRRSVNNLKFRRAS